MIEEKCLLSDLTFFSFISYNNYNVDQSSFLHWEFFYWFFSLHTHRPGQPGGFPKRHKKASCPGTEYSFWRFARRCHLGHGRLFRHHCFLEKQLQFKQRLQFKRRRHLPADHRGHYIYPGHAYSQRCPFPWKDRKAWGSHGAKDKKSCRLSSSCSNVENIGQMLTIHWYIFLQKNQNYSDTFYCFKLLLCY